jgi:hypothetical protein
MGSQPSSLLSLRVSEFNDGEVHQLISELSLTTGAYPDDQHTLRNFLISCVYRDGNEKRSRIKRDELNNPLGILTCMIEKLSDGLVRQICEELVRPSGSMESVAKMQLYQCLNKTIPVLLFPKRSGQPARRRPISRTALENWGWSSVGG